MPLSPASRGIAYSLATMPLQGFINYQTATVEVIILHFGPYVVPLYLVR